VKTLNHTTNIKAIFLPANVTSLIQYRQKFVGVLLEKMEKMENDNGAVQAIKTINIREVIT
jgi:hypothetical protein